MRCKDRWPHRGRPGGPNGGGTAPHRRGVGLACDQVAQDTRYRHCCAPASSILLAGQRIKCVLEVQLHRHAAQLSSTVDCQGMANNLQPPMYTNSNVQIRKVSAHFQAGSEGTQPARRALGCQSHARHGPKALLLLCGCKSWQAACFSPDFQLLCLHGMAASQDLDCRTGNYSDNNVLYVQNRKRSC